MSNNKMTIVKDAYASFGRGDIESFFKDFDPEGALIEADSLPYAGVHRGQAAATQALIEIGKAWKHIAFDINEIVAGERFVVAYGTFSATGQKTGKSISMPLAEVWDFNGDRVKSITPLYFDTAAAAAALA